MSEPFIQRIMAHHTTAQEAGMVFSQTQPKLAAFTHLVFLASKTVPPACVADLIAQTRRTYSGPLQVGEDLMSFLIDNEVTAQPHRPPATLQGRAHA
jgi:ribonuclease Z